MALTPSVLWRATRAYSFPASVVPVLLGTTLAARGYAFSGHAHFDGLAFALVLLGAVLAHFGSNVLNDYFDFVNGVDTRPEHGSGVLTGGQMTARQALVFGAALMAGAAACGLALLPGHSAAVLPLALIGLGCAVLYPAVLKRYALGDLLIILAFGLGLTLGAYAVQQSGTLSARQWLLVSLYAVPVCLLVDAILHAKSGAGSASLPALWPGPLYSSGRTISFAPGLEPGDPARRSPAGPRLQDGQRPRHGADAPPVRPSLHGLALVQARLRLIAHSRVGARATPAA